MFHWLYEMYFDQFTPLRVFSYPSFRIVASIGTAMLITLLLYPWFIEKLRAKQVGERIRTDGPEGHQKKAGTPTMGGILIVIALVFSTLLWTRLNNPLVWLVLLVTAPLYSMLWGSLTCAWSLLLSSSSDGAPGTGWCPG